MKMPSANKVIAGVGFTTGVIVGIIILIIIFITHKPKPAEQPDETKPCNHLDIKTTLLYVAKTEMWVDSLRIAKKGQRNRLIDSINFYRAKLEMDGNVIEY